MHSFEPTDFKGRRPGRAMETNVQGPAVQRQRIEVYVDVPVKPTAEAPRETQE